MARLCGRYVNSSSKTGPRPAAAWSAAAERAGLVDSQHIIAVNLLSLDPIGGRASVGDSRDFFITRSTRVDAPYRLFSQTKRTGRSQMAARLIPS